MTQETTSSSARKNLWRDRAAGEKCSDPAVLMMELADHLSVLTVSGIGEDLSSFGKAHRITYALDGDLPENMEAQYCFTQTASGLKNPGVIKYGTYVYSSLFGHELRHGWQHLSSAFDSIKPESPEEEVLLDRFKEADSRAVEFMAAVQCIYRMRLDHAYSRYLLLSLDSDQKKILLYSEAELDRLGREPGALIQAGRRVFDAWIAHAPAEEQYDLETEKWLLLSKTGRVKRTLFSIFNNLKDPFPQYVRRGVSPQFVEALVEATGTIDGISGKPENYLQQSRGLPFTDPFYTRICNTRLEGVCDFVTPSV